MLDELIEMHYARKDPQFQDPDAYDEEEWERKLERVIRLLDDAMDTLNEAIELHDDDNETLKKAGQKILDAETAIEDISG